MRNLTSLDTKALFDKFQETPRDARRLEIALHAFFLPETPQAQKDAYGQYLKQHIGPAMEAVMKAEDIEKLEVWESLGWLEDDRLDDFIRLARENRRTASLVWLLRLKAKRGCYHDREFPF